MPNSFKKLFEQAKVHRKKIVRKINVSLQKIGENIHFYNEIVAF